MQFSHKYTGRQGDGPYIALDKFYKSIMIESDRKWGLTKR